MADQEPDARHEGRAGPGDGATFAPSRLGGGRRRPPVLAIGWVVVLGSIAALGLTGRTSPGSTTPAVPGTGAASSPGPAVVAKTGTAEPTAGSRTHGGPAPSPREASSPRPQPSSSSWPDPVRLEVVRTTGSVFVHGDIHAANVVWVFISIQTESGRVAGWASLSFPRSVGEPDDPQPALRFDVEVAIPDDMRAGRLRAQATVYDALGRIVGSNRVDVPTMDTADTAEDQP